MKQPSCLVIATRKSPLALMQAEEVKKLLQAATPHLSIQFLELTTAGDKRTDVELTQIGGKCSLLKSCKMLYFLMRLILLCIVLKTCQ